MKDVDQDINDLKDLMKSYNGIVTPETGTKSQIITNNPIEEITDEEIMKLKSQKELLKQEEEKLKEEERQLQEDLLNVLTNT